MIFLPANGASRNPDNSLPPECGLIDSLTEVFGWMWLLPPHRQDRYRYRDQQPVCTAHRERHHLLQFRHTFPPGHEI
jgi:hypothetical protein